MADAPPGLPGLTFRQHLDSGGSADVLLYQGDSRDDLVAVKVLRRDGLSRSAQARFLEEAAVMATLADHPNIVRIRNVTTLPDGSVCLVMAYYPSPNLAVRARHQPLSVESVLRIGIQLAGAVETAHRAGIIHRDIKPANVLMTDEDRPALTDFGMADNAATGRGMTGDDLGVSVPWAAPEVLLGASDGDVRSDVYALAATLWHALVGRSPYERPGGDNSPLAMVERIKTESPPATGRAEVPTSLAALLADALAKDPARRPASALVMATRLQAVQRELRLADTPLIVLEGRGDRTGRPTRGAAEASAAQERVRTDPRRARPAQGRGPAWRVGREGLAGVRDLVARSTRRGRIVVLVGGVLVLGAGLAAAFGADLGGGGSAAAASSAMPGSDPNTPTHQPTPGQPAGAASTASTSLEQPPDQAALSARSVPGGVEFSWTYADARAGDTFAYRWAPSRAALPGAVVRSVSTSPVTVDGLSGGSICVQVQVVRSSGLAGPLSAAACGEAG